MASVVLPQTLSGLFPIGWIALGDFHPKTPLPSIPLSPGYTDTTAEVVTI